MEDKLGVKEEILKHDKSIALKEDIRTYDFGLGKRVMLKNVIELIVRSSGSHRLRTADGKLHIIPTGWIHVEIVDSIKKDWTT